MLPAKTMPRPANEGPGGGTFVELPALKRGLGGVLPVAAAIPRGAARYRLVLEGATGTLCVTTTAPGQGLMDAVCRFVLGALEDGSRA